MELLKHGYLRPKRLLTFFNDGPCKLSKACGNPINDPILFDDFVNKISWCIYFLLRFKCQFDFVLAFSELNWREKITPDSRIQMNCQATGTGIGDGKWE